MRFRHGDRAGACVVSVVLAALLASRPAAAQPKAAPTEAGAASTAPSAAPAPGARPSPAAGYPPSYPPGVDPWTHAPAAGAPPAATANPLAPMPYPPGAYAPGMVPMQPMVPLFVPNPSVAGTFAGANPYSMGAVYVEIKTSRPVRIERVISPGTTVPVCLSPCRQVLPRNSVYVITGEGVRTTSQFVLPDDRDRLLLDVNPGSTSQAVLGGVLVGAGLITAYLGLIAVAASGIQSDAAQLNDSSSNNSTNTRQVGVGLLVGGGLAGLIGLYLLLDSKTLVKSSTGSQFSQSPAHKHRFAFTARGIEF